MILAQWTITVQSSRHLSDDERFALSDELLTADQNLDATAANLMDYLGDAAVVDVSGGLR